MLFSGKNIVTVQIYGLNCNNMHKFTYLRVTD